MVVAQIMDQHGEIVDIQAQVYNAENLCFSVKAAKPLFTLNDRLLCDNYRVANLDHYQASCVVHLDGMKAEEKSNLRHIVTFFQHVPAETYKEFSVHWKHDMEVVLQSVDKDMLLFSHQQKPRQQDIAMFKEIKQGLTNKKGKTKKFFDFRFENQIIVK